LGLQFITTANFNNMLAGLASSAEVFVPRAVPQVTAWQAPLAEGGPVPAVALGGVRPARTSWQRLTLTERYATTPYRVDHPIKGFFFAAQENVGRYPSATPLEPSAPKRIVVGAKACDLVALKTYDAVFAGGDFKDGFYQARRASTLIVAADCPEPAETCWCTTVGGKPWPTEGFDVLLSDAEGGFLVEFGSEAGRAAFEKARGLLVEATPEQAGRREAARRGAERRLADINKDLRVDGPRQKLVRRQDRAKEWLGGVSACVECGACLFSCPTCYCFLLHDYPASGGAAVRAKAWDACIYGGYHLMAGGGSPRSDLVKRFRNRWMHKFDYFVDSFGFESCSGCGRCIGCCPGEIDLRKVIKSLEGA
jgi:ferredoxin